MSDPRMTPFNGRVAHVSLEGQVDAEIFVEGEVLFLSREVGNINGGPTGPRERQLVFGEGFRVLEDGPLVFGMAERDGYVGWMERHVLWPRPLAATHRVTVRLTVAREVPDIKSPGEEVHLSLGAEIAMTGEDGDWIRCATPNKQLWVPKSHLRPIAEPEPDEATVAERLLGTPYLWGGNSALGIDCSGLVQAALLACGLPCPGDSDLQEAAFRKIDRGDARRGDLVFWEGHVGMLLDPCTLIHANGHHMAVAIEPLDQAIARIGQKEFGEVTSYRRPRAGAAASTQRLATR